MKMMIDKKRNSQDEKNGINLNYFPLTGGDEALVSLVLQVQLPQPARDHLLGNRTGSNNNHRVIYT